MLFDDLIGDPAIFICTRSYTGIVAVLQIYWMYTLIVDYNDTLKPSSMGYFVLAGPVGLLIELGYLFYVLQIEDRNETEWKYAKYGFAGASFLVVISVILGMFDSNLYTVVH